MCDNDAEWIGTANLRRPHPIFVDSPLSQEKGAAAVVLHSITLKNLGAGMHLSRLEAHCRSPTLVVFPILVLAPVVIVGL